MYYDQIVFSALHFFADRATLLDWGIVFLSQYLPYFLIAGSLLSFTRVFGWRERVYLAATMALGVVLARGILTEVVRFFYDRPRPYEALLFEPLLTNGSGSFPSGHMALLFALGTALFFTNRRWGSWFLALSFLTGLARVAAGVHWPTDILGGALLGILSTLAAKRFIWPKEPRVPTATNDAVA
ncbi:MAG: phosphatase PAP2 family protein [Candidatus Liptonbacteria bacterium]|nr:phosphatase PAP2 family protein [Candidatus Liptonbacteria bacterium]